MKRKLAVLAAGIAAVTAVTATALAVTPGETPFPSPTIVGLFVTTNTYTERCAPNVMASRFPIGSTVNFKVFAADAKTKQVLTADDVKYAYIKIPGQPNVKLTYVAPTVAERRRTSRARGRSPPTMPTGHRAVHDPLPVEAEEVRELRPDPGRDVAADGDQVRQDAR